MAWHWYDLHIQSFSTVFIFTDSFVTFLHTSGAVLARTSIHTVIRIPSKPCSERTHWSARSHVPHVDLFFSFLISRPHHRLVFDNKTTFKLVTQDNLVEPTRPNHSPFRPHSSFLFIYLFFSTSHPALSNADTKTLPCRSRTLLHLSHFSFPFIRLHLTY